MKVLMIGTVWPEPCSSAAGFRDYNLIEIFQNAGWELHYASSAKINQFSEFLKNKNIPIHSLLINDASFDVFIQNLSPDFVIFDRFVIEEQFGWRVEKFLPKTIRILDTQDLHFLRRQRQKELKAEMVPNTDCLRELAAIYRSDCSLVLSTFEYELLLNKYHVPESLLQYFPFCYPEVQKVAGFHERKNFVFLGNFRHEPNHDAVFWLAREIWPKISAQLAGVELHIYGAYPPKEVMQLHNPKLGIHVLGPMACLESLGKYRVNLAPLRFGAGIKGKISDGWFYGTPCIATKIASEGMGDEKIWGGLVATGIEDFTTHALALYQNQKIWEKLQAQGIELLKNLFCMEKNSVQLLQAFENLKLHIDARREQNIIGKMLWYQGHRSTEYFSQWIELKNKMRYSNNICSD